VSNGNRRAQCLRDEELSQLADGERLPTDRHRAAEAHLDQCERCRRKYESFQTVGRLLKESLEGAAQADRSTDTHVTDEMLGTYLDGGPGTDERARIEQHLAECGMCLSRLVALSDTLEGAWADELSSRGQGRPAEIEAVRRMSVQGTQSSGTLTATCTECGAANSGDARYCGGCGAPLGPEVGARYCLRCSSRVPTSSRFCPNCGHILGAAEKPHPVWREVARWLRERKMHYLSLILAVVALFAASFYSFRKYQFYAIAALATVKWLADVTVHGLVEALVRGDPTVHAESSKLRRQEMLSTVVASLAAGIVQHIWLIAAGTAFLLSLLVRQYFAEFVVVGTVLALKWIIDESGLRLALSLLRAWRSRDAEQVDRLVAQLRREKSPHKRGREPARRASGE